MEKENYANSFGLQWNAFARSQFDSYTGLPISKTRLSRICGGDTSVFEGKTILEAGCGSGRFTEVILQNNAEVWAIDYSSAVDAAISNFDGNTKYHIAQADIRHLPFEKNSFDTVVCIGVLQHTPNPEESIQSLCGVLKNGGSLLIDHYSIGYEEQLSRKVIRYLLLKTSLRMRLPLVKILVHLLWPIHKMLWRLKKYSFFGKIRKWWYHKSPVVDYHGSYANLSDKIMFEWAVLDTHDTLTDKYKHLRTKEQIVDILEKCGMLVKNIEYAGNGVEAFAIKLGRE